MSRYRFHAAGTSLFAILLCLLLPGGFEAARAGSGIAAGERRVTLNGQALEVTWDAVTHAARTIAGVGGDLLEVKNIAALSGREVNDIGALLVGKYVPLLRIPPDQLVLRKAEKTDGSWYVSYQQTVRGMPVVDSSLGFSIDPDGRIKSLGALLYPDIPPPAAVKVCRADALKAARGLLREKEKGEYRLLAESVAIYPERKSGSIDYHRVYIFNLFPKGATHPASAVSGHAVFVDARNGKIVRTQPLLKPLGCCLPKEPEKHSMEGVPAK
ncbi:MAG: hypothetical protein FIA93_09050 [Deltaproteobacteria bacterium]|nr:hypothetical protein [Deltaproteobacteria bacterium]PWB62143.1 MAG: hypothetical protein C3F14_10425 [Deltaproteobacteria bacterium]